MNPAMQLVLGYLLFLGIFSTIFWHRLFGGWQALLWGNLLASAYWAPLGLIRLETVARRHHERQQRMMARIKETADKAHQIAADTHREVTGQEHPLAPGQET